jgi:transcriptional regulator with XRE-family HTH domain
MPYRKDPAPEVEPMLRELGALVRRSRYRALLSQYQVEALSGVDQTTISRVENGKAPGVRLRAVARILVVTNARPAEWPELRRR